MSGKPKLDDPAQSQRFLDLAKELEAEGGGRALENAVRHLAKQSPEPRRKVGKKARKK